LFGTWVLGWVFLSAEFADAGGTQTIIWQGPSSLRHVQLLSAAASPENGGRRIHFWILAFYVSEHLSVAGNK
jgi:hypothetical protein